MATCPSAPLRRVVANAATAAATAAAATSTASSSRTLPVAQLCRCVHMCTLPTTQQRRQRSTVAFVGMSPQRRTFLTSSLLMRIDRGRGSTAVDNGENKTDEDPSVTAPAKHETTNGSVTAIAGAAATRRRQPRSAGAKHSLRRVAVMAQQQPVPDLAAAGDAGKRSEGGSTGTSTSAGGDSNGSHTSTTAEVLHGTSRGHTSSSGNNNNSSNNTTNSMRRTREGDGATRSSRRDGGTTADDASDLIEATCVAESFDMEAVMALLEVRGFVLDPDGSGFESHEVVHARKWWTEDAVTTAPDGPAGDVNVIGFESSGTHVHAQALADRDVDVFVFESGTLVGWGLPKAALDELAQAVAAAAAMDALAVADRETETLEFRCDPTRETSALRGSGDVVVLGTREEVVHGDRLATTRAQIAFSSGLARSTKLAVLERSFTEYFESTRRIPELLAGRRPGLRGSAPSSLSPLSLSTSGGSRTAFLALFGLGGQGHLSQAFILQKTGELLSLRAQLNHYRELTDALPDIFWDARGDLGLEGYYEQVGRALDVGVRIKTLNQKMDYAQDIATVLREISSERHGTRLEWIIILLITVEVVFELRRVYLERQERRRKGETEM